jgi:hypothetical protein
MATVFISHAEEDQALALEIARGLEQAGYSTWYYERDSSPGLSYLLQVHRAIAACQSVVLVISSQALGSNQITAEVVRAHETGKCFVPVRTGISHEEFQRRKPEWNMAVGAASSIAVPPGGVTAILPQIIQGLRLLSAAHEGGDATATRVPAETQRRPTRTWAAAGAIALAVVLLAFYGAGRGGWLRPAGNAPRDPAPRPTANVPSPPGVTATVPRSRAADLVAASAGEPTAAPKANAAPAPASSRGPTRAGGPRCPESEGLRRVQERGRLEARDDLIGHTYVFVICEEHDIATGSVAMLIRSAGAIGSTWSDEAAARKAEDMERRAVDCEPTFTPVSSSGMNDHRSVVYVLCQVNGKPTSIEVHATTRKADAGPYPLKVLRVAWPTALAH